MKSLFIVSIFASIFLFSSCAVGPLISQGEIFKNLTQVTSNEGTNINPVLSRDGKKMLFVSKRDGNYNIYLRNNPNEKTEIQKTDHPGDDIHPCFSPDGTKFCFSSNRNGNFDIYIMDVMKGFTCLQVTSSEYDEIRPDWSPDGDLIVFSQYSRIDGEWYIWIKKLSNGQLIQICKGLFPKFSPDGKNIYYKKNSKSYYQLWKIDIDGENNTQLTSNDNWGVGTFALNPEGKKIIFSTIKNSYDFKWNYFYAGDDLWILDLENGNQIQVTTHKGSDVEPVWSPDHVVYFCSDRMGDMNIWSFKLDF
jgi:TolB protein